MPTTPNEHTLESLRRLAVRTLTYALAVALVALAAPSVLTPMPAVTLLPKPPPVVARVSVASPPMEPAPNLSKARS
ncbi:MAG: hypothetical protein EPO51_23595 [Phenylobacterium sp.]|uniref:hypothetical protein n=1 Tax=Phenylobacterium sp. TaxID=1871053 RepID=UPI00121E6572|nr:hypothetical protein [Phenylobacterium sp.]TAJ69246.1 MAG: hypothetical protein EPO51_23595 [Phenylobacterium sp.]